MKLNKFAHLLALVMVTAVITGCPKRPEDLSAIHKQPPALVNDENDTNKLAGLAGSTNINQGEYPQGEPIHTNWIDHPEILAAYTVHFAFDSSAVRSDEKSKISAVADYLKNNSPNAVRVEGNCDERGTAGYNLALGERRASALRGALIELGIQPGRVETVSYGLERPVDTAHNEAAWSKNRRGDFIVLTPPPASAPASANK
jgi:peptidoglycan-associated lipoprotein